MIAISLDGPHVHSDIALTSVTLPRPFYAISGYSNCTA
jgi:hypothetical protein